MNSNRAEHLAVDKQVTLGRAPLFLPPLARDLLATQADALARLGLLHPAEAEVVRRLLGAV